MQIRQQEKVTVRSLKVAFFRAFKAFKAIKQIVKSEARL